MKFYIIAGVGWTLNVVAVSVVANYLRPAGVARELWLNVGALAGVAASFLWDFLGFKYLVFKEAATGLPASPQSGEDAAGR